jgi:hypothetical protein
MEIITMHSRVAFGIILTVGLTVPSTAQLDPFGASKIELAKTDIAILTKATEAYKTKTGAFPAKLKNLVDEGYVKPRDGKKLLDPWGKEYEYDPKGSRNDGKRPDIWATAPDKTEFGNWPKKEK